MLTLIIAAAVVVALVTLLVISDRRRIARFDALSHTGKIAVIDAEREAELARAEAIAHGGLGRH